MQVSNAQREAQKRYMLKRQRLEITLYPEEKEKILAEAAEAEMPLAAYVRMRLGLERKM